MSDIIEAIKEDNFLKVKEAIKAGADLNQMVEIAEDEYTPLLFFALRSRVSLDIVELLIDSGANIEYINDDGVGVVDEAVIFGKLETIKYLVETKGMDIKTTKRKSGLTPFMQACCYGDIEIIEYIKDRGIDIDQRDNNGMSALDYAKRLGKRKVEEYLLNIC